MTLSHGEILAVYPTAGSQYHWVAMLSAPRWRNSVSWTTGMLNVVGLWLGAATAGYLSSASAVRTIQDIDNQANLLISAIAVNSADVSMTPARQYAIFVGITLVGPLITILIGQR